VTLGSSAMVLAAGLGLRMRPLTLTRPKPLVEVAGKPLIEHAFDRLRAAQVQTAVVNVHYLADQIEAWAGSLKSPRIVISDERGEVLDTGGGISLALPHLGKEPFFVLNSDSFWQERGMPDDSAMDCLLLLSPLEKTIGYDGTGDFVRDTQGRLRRKTGTSGEPLAYIGGYLVHPRLFEGAPAGKYSMNVLWDRAIAKGRLHGIVHAGKWLHVGTPEAIALAEAALAEG
jgi:N-acetyl-alpha-D-muramate 1-phosphate uridylyltransferase